MSPLMYASASARVCFPRLRGDEPGERFDSLVQL